MKGRALKAFVFTVILGWFAVGLSGCATTRCQPDEDYKSPVSCNHNQLINPDKDLSDLFRGD